MSFDERLQEQKVNELFRAIMSLETLEEHYRFFEDLCTVKEIQAMAQRFRVAQLLSEGCTYEEIVQETGMSSATISRIKRFLDYGADGYHMAIDRLDEMEED